MNDNIKCQKIFNNQKEEDKENPTQLNSSLYTFENTPYTDTELFQLLDLNNPTDRELEAKLYSVIEKYNSIKSNIGQQLKQFYISIFNHFFETDDEENDVKYQEGFQNNDSDTVNKLTPDITEPPIYTKSLAYTKGILNPILKETIKRVVSIDSSFRKVLTYPYTTEFTFNLSESLRDVVSLKLYSVSIPYNWYTINKNYGSNFFYINGVSNGINNGNFNYKISIPYGNYTETTLINAVNNSIQTNLINANPDINFGSTDVSYNSVNGRCTLQMDITNNYNETNYYLYFPKITYADVDLTTYGTPLSIPELFGYRNDTYYPFTIYSDPVLNNLNSTYLITSQNNYIKILIYSPNSYNPLFNSNVISIPITLSLPINTYATGQDIFNDLSQILQKNENLVTNYTQDGTQICPIIKKISVSSDISNGYYPTSNYIKYQLSIKPKRNFFLNELNQKMVIEFPDDSLNTTPIWCNTTYTSLFNFNKTSLPDASGIYHYISDEMQNINSEIGSYNTSYKFNSPPYIILKCITPYYDLSEWQFTSHNDISNNYNDYLININSIPLNQNINLNQYYLSIQKSLDNLKNFTQGEISGTFLNNSNNKPFFNFNINKKFNNYELDISGSFLSTIFKFDPILLNNITYYSSIGIQVTYDVFNCNIRVINKKNNYKYDISLTPISSTGRMSMTNIITYINTVFNDNVDLSQCSLGFSNIDGSTYQLTFKVNIQKNLTNNDYKIYLLDESSNIIDPNGILYSIYNNTTYYYGNNISWYKNLSFIDASYSALDVSSNETILSNTLLLDSSNNTFQLIPIYDPSGGVYDTINPTNNILTYTLAFNPSKEYTKEEIKDLINTALMTQNDGIANGSYIDITNLITTFRVNINKTFTAKDYSIQFYNSKFNKCNFGSKSSAETVTSDTTLGWKMGFRSNIEYYLTESNIITSSLDGKTYYGNNTLNNYTYDTTNGVVTLEGDTSVNVNLYNYFLIILDDYTQNHLNDGLVTTITADMDVSLPSYASRASYKYDPSSNTYGVSSTTSYEDYNKLTNAQIYSANQLLSTNLNKYKNNTVSSGPFIQDIFGIIPMKTAGLSYGQTYTEFGGTLQIQERVYFGPVNISRMTVKLMTDKGNILDLNNQNWSFSLIAEQLYSQ